MLFLHVWLANPGNPATSPLAEIKEDRHAGTDKQWGTEKKEKGEGGGATTDRKSLALLKKQC